MGLKTNPFHPNSRSDLSRGELGSPSKAAGRRDPRGPAAGARPQGGLQTWPPRSSASPTRPGRRSCGESVGTRETASRSCIPPAEASSLSPAEAGDVLSLSSLCGDRPGPRPAPSGTTPRNGLSLPYLDAGVAGLGLRLDAAAARRPGPGRGAGVPALLAAGVAGGWRLPALVGEDGGDGVGSVCLDEEAVQGGRALRDGGGLVGGIGLVRVAAVNQAALRDMDAGGAAHPFPSPLRPAAPPAGRPALLPPAARSGCGAVAAAHAAVAPAPAPAPPPAGGAAPAAPAHAAPPQHPRPPARAASRDPRPVKPLSLPGSVLRSACGHWLFQPVAGGRRRSTIGGAALSRPWQRVCFQAFHMLNTTAPNCAKYFFFSSFKALKILIFTVKTHLLLLPMGEQTSVI